MKIKIDIPKLCKKDNFGYHYGTGLYKDIRPLALQDVSSGDRDYTKNMKKDEFSAYSKEVYMFPEPLTKDMIESLIKNGFNNWKAEELYEYKINLNEFGNNLFSLHSTSEEAEFIDEYWDKTMAEYDNRNEGKAAFKKLKKSMLKQTNLTLSDVCAYLNKAKIDMGKFVKYNIKHGSKYQYASYIPHLSVTTTTPINWVTINRIF